MNIGILLLAFLFVNSGQLGAQSGHRMGEFGLRFMPTFSSFQMQNGDGGDVNGTPKLGLGAGLFLGFNFTRHFGLQGEIMYTAATQQYQEPTNAGEVSLRYVNVPVLMSINTSKGKRVNFNIVAGPQVGISVGSRVFASNADGNAPLLAVKKGDLGFAYGGGLDFGLNPAKTIRLGIGFRGVYGLLDISDGGGIVINEGGVNMAQTNIKTYAGYVGLSVLFGKAR